MKLLLLRHGQAVHPEPEMKDFDRSLSQKGQRQSHKMGNWLKEEGFQIDQLIFSEAKRTTETTQIVSEYCSISSKISSKDLYLTDAKSILKYINEHAKGDTVLYVGHNFGISQLVGVLSGVKLTLTTCMLAIIEFDISDWNECFNDSGILKELIQPKNL